MIQKIIGLLCIVSLFIMTGFGAMVITPATGFVYSDVKGPLTATSNTGGTKIGRAECASILGLVALGDASIETAARNGGITKVKTIDYETWSLLGIYAKLTVVVTGE